MGPSADWSNAGSWIDGVPNNTGAVANFATAPTASVTTSIALGGPFTVGSIHYGSNSNIGNFSWTIVNSNGLTLNQDDAGSGNATITNSNTNTGANNALIVNSGTVTLADNLRAVNSSSSTADSGAIQFGSVIAGTGAIVLRSEQAIDPNMSFTQARGAIRLTAANTYVGPTAVEKGLVVFTNTVAAASTVFGAGATNIITLGNAAAPADDAALGFQTGATATNVIMSQPIVVAAGSGSRTLAVLPNPTAATYTISYSGTVALGAGSALSLHNPDTFDPFTQVVTGGTVGVGNMSGIISGNGSVKKTGGGLSFLNAANTYTGDTTIEGGVLVASATTLPSGAGRGNLIINSGAMFGLTGATGNVNGLNGSGAIKGYNNAATKTLNVGLNNASGSFSGTILDGRIDTGSTSGTTLGITKTGTGTQVFSGSYAYTGLTNVNGGKLLVNGSHTGTSTSGYTVNASGTLGGTGTVHRNITVAGGTLAPGASIGTFNTVGDVTLNSGNFNWEFSGGGGLPSNNANVLGADILSVSGTLSINLPAVLLGSDLGTIPVNLGNKLTLAAYGGGTPSPFFAMPDDTVVSVGGKSWLINYDDTTPGLNGGSGSAYVTLTATNPVSAVTAKWTGTNGGSGSWSSVGTAAPNPGWNTGSFPNSPGSIAQFIDPVSFDNATTVQDAGAAVTIGALQYGNNNNMGDFAWTIINTSGIAFAQNETSPTHSSITNSNTNTGAGNALIVDTGTMGLLGGSLRVVNSSGSTANNGAIQIGSAIVGGGAIALRSEHAIDPDMSLTQTKGAIRLTAANTYTGTTAIEKGLVAFTSPSAFGSSAITLGNVAAPADSVAMGFQSTVNNDNMSRPIVVAAGSGARTIAILPDVNAASYTVTYSGAVTLEGNTTVTLYNPDTVTGAVTLGTVAVQNMTGVISGEGIVKKTGGGLTFINNPATNSYSGDTIVEEGILVSFNAVPNGVGKGNVVVNSGATFALSGSDAINGLSGSGTIRPYGNATTLTVGDNNQSSLFSGEIGNTRIDNLAAQTISLAKIGTGTLTLTGANTYTGATAVNGGKLIVNGTHTGVATNGYTVNATGTLGGKGTIERNVVVAAGGTLAPGDVVVNDTVGTLTIGGLTLNDGARTAFQLNPTDTTLGAAINDYVDIVGALTVAGATTINFDIFNATNGGNLSTSVDRTWTLASYDSLAESGTPTFNITGTVGGASLAIVPDDNVGNPSGPGTIRLTVLASTEIPGDFNKDGKVDAADYVVWRKNPNSFLPATYATWRANFGNPPGSGSSLGDSSAVPEPTGCLLLAAAGILGAFVPRRRQ
jgi:autotransporter-associated beta strand protein